MKQRLEVARALAVKPDMLLLDEPFGALDSITRLIMRGELLRIWREERNTVIFVTHDIDEAVQLADRVAVMSGRPANIQKIVNIDIAHPRDISSPRYLRTAQRYLGTARIGAPNMNALAQPRKWERVFWPVLAAALLLLLWHYAVRLDADQSFPFAAGGREGHRRVVAEGPDVGLYRRFVAARGAWVRCGRCGGHPARADARLVSGASIRW